MADLPGSKRTEPVRVIGADPTTGDETNYQGVTLNNDAMVTDKANTSGVYGEITVGTTPVPARVGGSNLVGRKLVHIFVKDNEVYWGYNSSVTTTTGTRIFKNQLLTLEIGPNIDIYLVANAAGKAVNIGELS